MEEQQFIAIMDSMVTISNMSEKFESQEDIMLNLINSLNTVETQTGNSLIPRCIEVKNSTISGRGVFATNEIKKGTVVTLYPCDMIEKNGIAHILPKNKEQILKYNKPGDTTISDYKYNIDLNLSIHGFPENLNLSQVGHIINDPYDNVSELSYLKNMNDLGSKSFKYFLKNEVNSNCVIVNNKNYVYIKTTKDIKIGEELLASYGPCYWCKNLNAFEFHIMLVNYILTLNQKQSDIIKKLIFTSMHTDMGISTA